MIMLDDRLSGRSVAIGPAFQNNVCRLALAWLLLIGATAFSGANSWAGTINAQTRAELFAELKTYIDANSRDGSFIVANDPTRPPIHVRLKSLHPLLFKKRDVYMLCADFVSSDGKKILIDFFLKPALKQSGAFRVQYYVVGNRSRFSRLFERLL